MTTRRRLLAVFAIPLLAVGAAELVLARLSPQATWDRMRASGPPTEPSEILPYRLIPGATSEILTAEFETSVRINSDGYRGPELVPAGPERFRILAVGDSFTFGWGVEDDETWAVHLEHRLQEARPERRIEVVNGGFAAGVQPDTYYLYLKERGLDLEPDLVLVGLFIGNDVEPHGRGLDAPLEWTEVDADGLPLRIQRRARTDAAEHGSPAGLQRRYRYPVLRNSHVVQALAARFRSAQPPPADFNRWLYRAEYADRTVEKMETANRLLSATAELCGARGIPLVVLMIPAREQVLLGEYSYTAHETMRDHEIAKPQRLFREHFEREGIGYLDLLPPIAAEGSVADLYYPIDLHWTPAGTAWAARVIADDLLARGLVPSD